MFCFLLKIQYKGGKIIHSICKTINGQKHVFPVDSRNLANHPLKIQEKVKETYYRAKQHIAYNLTGEEVTVYLNAVDGKF